MWPQDNWYQIINEHGFEPDMPLEFLLRAIIDAHPDELERPDDERLCLAFARYSG